MYKLPNQLKDMWGEERLKLYPRLPILADLNVWLHDQLHVKASVSLNSKLLIGPDLLNNLVDVLLEFRQEQIAIGADIEAKFHKCAVTKEDQSALRFLWQKLKCEQPPKVYQILVMIFGATSSSCTANYILWKTVDAGFVQKVASKNQGHFQDISRTIK